MTASLHVTLAEAGLYDIRIEYLDNGLLCEYVHLNTPETLLDDTVLEFQNKHGPYEIKQIK